MSYPATQFDRVLNGLPRAYPGPGGACAVLRDGQVLARHAWGWANAEQRIAFTPRTLFRMCSITKQFTCGTLLDRFADPAMLDGDVRDRLPRLGRAAPGALHLCHNQSGLRDYWAVAMLHGSPVEAAFGDREADAIIAATASLHFVPGTRYSYCNQNFRLLSDILEDRTGRSFAELLAQGIFAQAGMQTAFLAADTAAMPDGTQGYEGSVETGFRPAVNRILWTGDAGLGASLDDMIAWERHIDATRDAPDGLYRRLATPVTFSDGATAEYGFGLGRRRLLGREATGHGGALRGWRSHRVYLPAERVSVVVMFNHLSDAQEAAVDVLAALLDEDRPARAAFPLPSWRGTYVEPETGLAARIDAAPGGQLRLRYGHSAERLDMQADGSAGTDGTVLRLGDGGLRMHRPADNQSSLLQRCDGVPSLDVAGRYHCGELGTALTVADAGGPLYGAFSGALGQGRMELLEPLGPDLWTLPCPRALDHTPPGDWTLQFMRDAQGQAARVTVGCWLARGLVYTRRTGVRVWTGQ
jgi:D-aminopeptidase